eukprot:5824292-Amphidinium_carterae.1
MPIQLREMLTGTAAMFGVANNSPMNADVAGTSMFLDHSVAIHKGAKPFHGSSVGLHSINVGISEGFLGQMTWERWSISTGTTMALGRGQTTANGF